MTPTSPPPIPQQQGGRLAEVIPLRTPTVAEPPTEPCLADGVQLAFPLLLVLGGDGGGE